MKCLIITGSPCKNYGFNGEFARGFTAKLVEEVKAYMLGCGEVEFEEVVLREIQLPYCSGCYSCFFHGEEKCPHADRLQPIVHKMEQADCLILTSPVYALNVSALIKNFFDHGAYLYHRPRFFEKKALVISSTAGGAAKSVCKYMSDTLQHWGYNRVHMLPITRRGANVLTADMQAQCRRTAERFYEDAAGRKLHGASLKNLFFYNIWRYFAVQETSAEADRNYWRETGLINHPYAPIIKVGVFKRLYVGIVRGMIKSFSK